MSEHTEQHPRELSDHNPPAPDETAETLLDGEPGRESVTAVELDDRDVLEAGDAAEELGIELPENPEEAQALLLRELSEARQEAGEYLETLQRVAAEFDNYRKRVERDHAENVQRASLRIIEHLIPTLDNFDAALAYEPQTPAEEKILEGVRGTYDLMLETLANEGFVPIAAAGVPFDPAVHEAVAGPTAGGDGDLVVAEELRRGYLLRERVVRASLVTVEHEGDDA
jgi:molecular chaperone GrpE